MGESEGMEVGVMEVEDEKEEKENVSTEMKWETIMQRMVLRVLLVEADDSTRQIVGAILRKYNYKVAAISDGLKAWEILKRRHSNIDLILTELNLPSISGYALLTLIMEHDGCKDIPVIIMSSQDSISMVLKCLLKGAADFLVKPVRKNELKNLWRHVWRRLANNTGRNPQNLIAGEHKAEATFENNPATDDSVDNVSSSQKSSRFREKATDAQGLSQINHGEETGVSCRQRKHQAKNVKLEEGLPLHTSYTDDKTDKLGTNIQPSKEVYVSAAVRVEDDGPCTGITTDGGSDGLENHTFRANIDDLELPQPSIEAVDLTGRTHKLNSTGGASSCGKFNGHYSTPALDLSLERPLDPEIKEVHRRQILNHSSASAFTWYRSTKKPQASFSSSGGELPKVKGVADSSPWLKSLSNYTESKPDILVPHSTHCDPVSQHHQIGPVSLPGLTVDSGVWPSYGSAFQPIFCPYTGPPARSSNSALQREESSLLASHSLYSDPETHSSIKGCGQVGDQLKTRESVERPGYSSSQVVDPSGSSTQCNDFRSQPKISAHGSASEVTDVNAPSMKESSFVEESEDCKSFIHDPFKLTMGLHSAERQAALVKFRQKRKDRCFEKKVRYQSRKKLAEQRPRMKGQFVRQVRSDQTFANDKP